MKSGLIAAIAALAIAAPGSAQIIISEVHPNGSGGGASYAADWFELTNTGAAPVNITGWSWDDDSFTPGVGLFSGVSIIQPGQSVVFLGGANNAAFSSFWFGASPPPGFTLGNMTGPGLGTGGDQVWVFDAANTLVTAVAFGSTAAELRTLDNAAGISGTTPPPPPPNPPTISTFSAVGVNGAFSSVGLTVPGGQSEIGSPGVVPEPSSLALAGIGGLIALRNRKKLKGLIAR